MATQQDKAEQEMRNRQLIIDEQRAREQSDKERARTERLEQEQRNQRANYNTK